jgi:hypothetical protein
LFKSGEPVSVQLIEETVQKRRTGLSTTNRGDRTAASEQTVHLRGLYSSDCLP